MYKKEGDIMNYIMKYGKNFIGISNNIEAECHKHWLLQMFLSSQKELTIEVNGQPIPCSSIIINMDTPHKFNTQGEPHFTMLIDPTTKLGQVMRELLNNRPFFVIPYEKNRIMQENFRNMLEQKKDEAIQFFIQSVIFPFSYNNLKAFDDRVIQVLNLFDDFTPEDEILQIKYLSKRIGLSESRLAHLFKAETGIPLKSFIVLRKLQRAYELIFNGENITTAALNAGFNTPSHLAHTNKLMTGMSAKNILRNSEFLKVFQ